MHAQSSISTEIMELPLVSVSNCKVQSVIQFLHARSEMAVEINSPDLAPSDFHMFRFARTFR